MVIGRHTFLLASFLLLAACGGDHRPEALKALDTVSPSAAEHPASFVEATKVAMLEGRPVALWEALPASYQADVQSLLNDFGREMDQEFWDQGMRMMRKLAQVLEEKEELLRQTPLVVGMMQQMPDAAEALTRWGSMMKSIADSELGDLSRLRNLNVEEFLEGSGAALIQQLMGYTEVLMGAELSATMDKVESMQARVKDMDGNRALVEVTANGEAPTEEVFEQVEGRWVPVVLAAQWSQTMQLARGVVDQVGSTEDREELRTFLTQVEESLDQMLAAKDANQLQGILTKVVFQFMARAAAAQTPTPAVGGNGDG